MQMDQADQLQTSQLVKAQAEQHGYAAIAISMLWENGCFPRIYAHIVS